MNDLSSKYPIAFEDSPWPIDFPIKTNSSPILFTKCWVIAYYGCPLAKYTIQ